MKKRKVTAIILSGGVGTRLGAEIPKQYLKVRDRAIITYSLKIFLEHPDIDEVFIVAAEKWQKFILEEMKNSFILSEKFAGFASPGENRQLSIWNAMETLLNIAEDDDCTAKENIHACEKMVMIHDAARPCITVELITKLLAAYNGYDGVMPASPMNNTMYVSSDGKNITALLDRGHIYAGHTPELFNFEKYYEANKSLLPDKIKTINGSSEPAVMAGMKIVMIENDEKNFKITSKTDLESFENYIFGGVLEE